MATTTTIENLKARHRDNARRVYVATMDMDMVEILEGLALDAQARSHKAIMSAQRYLRLATETKNATVYAAAKAADDAVADAYRAQADFDVAIAALEADGTVL